MTKRVWDDVDNRAYTALEVKAIWEHAALTDAEWALLAFLRTKARESLPHEAEPEPEPEPCVASSTKQRSLYLVCCDGVVSRKIPAYRHSDTGNDLILHDSELERIAVFRDYDWSVRLPDVRK